MVAENTEVSVRVGGADAVQRDDRLIAFFNEHGVAPEYSDYVSKFISLMGGDLHSYQNYANRPMPPEAGECSTLLNVQPSSCVTAWL